MSDKVVDGFRAFVAGADKSRSGDTASASQDPESVDDARNRIFERRLNEQVHKVVLDKAPLLSGTVELVGLDDVRRALGSTWSDASAHVGELAESEIQRSLTDKDFYKAYGTSSFLICFVGMDKTRAENTASRIAARIKERLAEHYPSIAQEVQPLPFVSEIDVDAMRLGDHETLVERLVSSLVALRRNHESAINRFRSPMLRRAKLSYSPAWHVAKQVIAFNRCSLDVGLAPKESHSLLGDYPLAESRHLLTELDFIALTRAIRAMYMLLKLGRTVILLIPVRYSTITGTKSGAMYQRLLETIRAEHRALLAIEIRDLPSNEDPTVVAQRVAGIKPLVRWLALAMDVQNPNPELFVQDSLWAFSIDLSGWKSTDPALRPNIVRFRNTAIEYGLNTIAHGANSIGLALAAVEAGLTYIDGAAIHPTTAEPRPPSPLHPVLSILPQNRISHHAV